MRQKVNTRDKILSLLLDVAMCSFVRITEHKKSRNTRYQFGELDDETLNKLLAQSQQLEFIQENTFNYENFQFNVSLFSPQHAHIECVLKQDAQLDKQNKRQNNKGLQRNSIRFDVTLLHHIALPSFVVEICNNVNLKPSNSGDEKSRQANLLFKSISLCIENLSVIDHYLELTNDSLTKLKSRTALQRGIDEQIIQSNIALCMIHCIDFQHVNRKFGQAKGDTVLHEIAGVIQEHTRLEDNSGRFGGALFGIAINANTVEEGNLLANKLQTVLHKKAYLQNALRLSFNVGVAFVTQEEDQLDASSSSSLLINRAEQALKAAQSSNKPSIVQWEPGKFKLDQQEFNYLGGIFTPDNVTNYRNMLLLWDISSIIADEHTFARLLKAVVERLAYTFEFAYSGIVSLAEGKESSEQESNNNNYAFKLTNNTDISELNWNEYEYQTLIKDSAKLAIENAQHSEHQEDGFNALVIPLDTSTKECFFIMGSHELLDLTHDTVMLFVGFSRQIGKALKRSQLEDQLNKNLEQQNAKLAQELLELKAGLQSSALVYCSEKMQKVVQQTQRAAQTDATVLITGESGTGKEKLINAVHTLSPRSSLPLVIVDCGSIPETLIESELFGHTKGAFTGALSDSKGKIQAANGGILVLDEIGELPISMQPKLLRFVQEKLYTPVGSNKSRNVDVKIVAVTNRDLAYEVSQGTFRKDLFYRLNVVALHNPPLRERIEDIELLCQHFLSKFARQFDMDKKHLSAQTIEKMKTYSWPGNIRELENKLMQASLLTISDEILFEDLKLELTEFAEPITSQHNHVANNDNGASYATLYTEPSSSNQEQVITPNLWYQHYSAAIDALLGSMDIRSLKSISIGQVVELVLLKKALEKCGSMAKTAVLLQLPISTTRRRLQKDLPNLTTLNTDSNWLQIINLLSQLVDSSVVLISPVDTVKELTAHAILKLHTSNMALASQLMGVSEPTMYKIRKQLQLTLN